MQRACGMPSGDFDNNPDAGYRTLVPNKITQNQHPSQKRAEKEFNEKRQAYMIGLLGRVIKLKYFALTVMQT